MNNKTIEKLLFSLVFGFLVIWFAWVSCALFFERSTGNYYINDGAVYEDVRFGDDHCYYEGDEDRAFMYWKELQSLTQQPQPQQQPNSGDIIRP